MTDVRKQLFIDTVEKLFNENEIPQEALDFFADYKKGSASNKKEITEKGITIIKALREVNDWITASSLGEKIDVSGRSVSGTMRKLVLDGYVNKMDGSPASYKISDKGMNFDLESVIEEN